MIRWIKEALAYKAYKKRIKMIPHIVTEVIRT